MQRLSNMAALRNSYREGVIDLRERARSVEQNEFSMENFKFYIRC